MSLRVEMRVSKGSRVTAPSLDMNWIVDNYNKLRTNYPDKWIAVKNKIVIDLDSDLEPLLQRLRQNYGRTHGFATEFIAKRPRNMII